MPPSHRCGRLVGSPSLLEQHWWLSSHMLAQIITSTMKRRASNVTTSLAGSSASGCAGLRCSQAKQHSPALLGLWQFPAHLCLFWSPASVV